MAGEARNVTLGTIHEGNSPITVVTFRLEQHDPSAGRTGMITVRLRGSRALGFVSDGDWVEVQGKHRQGFVNASEAVNRTSGTQYRSAGGLRKGCLIVAYVLIIGFIAAIAVSIVLGAL